MNLSDALIKIGGIFLFVVGICLLLSLVGINFLGISLGAPIWAVVIVGILFVVGGVALIRGGSINL